MAPLAPMGTTPWHPLAPPIPAPCPSLCTSGHCCNTPFLALPPAQLAGLGASATHPSTRGPIYNSLPSKYNNLGQQGPHPFSDKKSAGRADPCFLTLPVETTPLRAVSVNLVKRGHAGRCSKISMRAHFHEKVSFSPFSRVFRVFRVFLVFSRVSRVSYPCSLRPNVAELLIIGHNRP